MQPTRAITGPLSLVLLMAAAVATGPVETIPYRNFNLSATPQQLLPGLLTTMFSLKVNSSTTQEKPTPLTGNLVKPGQVPWHVSFQIADTAGHALHFCSGALISSSAVLTAATCFYFANTGGLIISEEKLKAHLRVIAGTTNVIQLEGTVQKRTLSKIIKLDRFGTTGGVFPQYNLAIVKVSEPFKLDVFTKPVAWAAKPVEVGKGCSVSGWDRTLSLSAYRPEMGASNESMASSSVCQSYFQVRDEIIDVRCTMRDTSFCEGEIGGPVVCDGKLAGIAFGLGCTYPYAPFTATDYHDDWITINTAATTSGPIGVFVSVFMLIVFQQAAM